MAGPAPAFGPVAPGVCTLQSLAHPRRMDAGVSRAAGGGPSRAQPAPAAGAMRLDHHAGSPTRGRGLQKKARRSSGVAGVAFPPSSM